MKIDQYVMYSELDTAHVEPKPSYQATLDNMAALNARLHPEARQSVRLNNPGTRSIVKCDTAGETDRQSLLDTLAQAKQSGVLLQEWTVDQQDELRTYLDAPEWQPPSEDGSDSD